ncbi:MAG TPA: CoA protein activase [Firmicutes bacterium]|nr:CoA protein activase [Bacillota bacterium]
MRITFPYMGSSPPVFKQLFRELGHEVIAPPPPSKRTLDLGTKFAPEFACIPFKILLGTYLEAIELGADTIVSTGGVGPCRAGYYGELHRSILHSLGYNVRLIILEPPLRRPGDFFRALGELVGSLKGWLRLPGILQRVWAKLNAIDRVEKAAHAIRPFEINKGETTRVYDQCLHELDAACAVLEIQEAERTGLARLAQIPQDRSRRPLKVGLIGEIYVVLEPFANHNVQTMLEEMGVIADRSIYLAEWTRGNAVVAGERDIKGAARPFLSELIGGHGVNSIGETVLYARRGFDGIVQLAPFACIPEIVAKSLLPRVSRDLGIPVLTLFLDEQTGEAGIKTRLEAFVDLLAQRRKKREGQVVWAGI